MPIITRCLPNAHAFEFLGDVTSNDFRAYGTYGHFKCALCGWEEYVQRDDSDEE